MKIDSELDSLDLELQDCGKGDNDDLEEGYYNTEQQITEYVSEIESKNFKFDREEVDFNSELIKKVFGKQLVSIDLVQLNNISPLYKVVNRKTLFKLSILIGKRLRKAFIFQLTKELFDDFFASLEHSNLIIPAYPAIHKFYPQLTCKSLTLFFHKLIFSNDEALSVATFRFLGTLMKDQGVQDEFCLKKNKYLDPNYSIYEKS